jgi:Zn-finger nucleic acid-binding protein
MRTIDCPECAVSLQPFFAKGATGALVELDRCAKCTRLWFDVRELETAVGQPFLPRLRGATSAHGCPVCKTALSASLIRGDVPIEECGSCGGALLDERDFELISGARLTEVKPPAPQPPPAAPSKKGAKLVEFTCAKCRRRFPITEAGNVNGATVCKSCELEPWPNQPSWYGRRQSGPEDLGQLLDDLVGFLFDGKR